MIIFLELCYRFVLLAYIVQGEEGMEVSKDELYCDTVKSMYQETINEASDIIARAQNPLAALGIVAALLIYLVNSAKDFPSIIINKDILIIIFYICIFVAFCFVSKSCYYLFFGFKAGGYSKTSIGPIKDFENIYSTKSDENDFRKEIIQSYIIAIKNNQKKNEERMEYIRLSMETIIRAVICCFVTGFLYCVITILSR